jgi:2'-hydroxyisoflavone reductase
LAPVVGHYTFISTLSVYAEPPPGLDESGVLATMADEGVEEITGETYGPLKALCEQAVVEEMNGRALIVRPGLIVGPHDVSDRFTYWPVRVARGGRVLAPGSPEAPVQFIDVRDLADWTIRAIEEGLTGPYNATGPDKILSMGRFLDSCLQVAGSNADFVWAGDDFLTAHEVAAYTEMPLWVPAEYDGFNRFDCRKAIASGLTFRPLAETIRDTLNWHKTRPPDHAWRAGLTPEREAALLKAWDVG